MTAMTLTDGQETLLRQAAANNGIIYLDEWGDPAERKSAKALIRLGMLSCGDPRGYGWHHVTYNGGQWLSSVEENGPQS